MARPLRLEYHGALYHVTSHGDGQEDIYLDDDDRAPSFSVLEEVVKRFNWTVHDYCLMSNHYHLLVETPDGNLAQGMRHYNGVYTQRFNRRHHRVGHVFQGRYKAIIVQKESYLGGGALHCAQSRACGNGAQREGLALEHSYRSTAGFKAPPPWLQIDWILSAFGNCKGEAIARYRSFVAEGKNQTSPWERLKNQIYLGDELFVGKLLAGIEYGKDLSEIPIAQRRKVPKSIDYYARNCSDRDQVIVEAYQSGSYSLKAIGDYFGLHYSRVSRIVAAAGKAKGKT